MASAGEEPAGDRGGATRPVGGAAEGGATPPNSFLSITRPPKPHSSAMQALSFSRRSANQSRGVDAGRTSPSRESTPIERASSGFDNVYWPQGDNYHRRASGQTLPSAPSLQGAICIRIQDLTDYARRLRSAKCLKTNALRFLTLDVRRVAASIRGLINMSERV